MRNCMPIKLDNLDKMDKSLERHKLPNILPITFKLLCPYPNSLIYHHAPFNLLYFNYSGSHSVPGIREYTMFYNFD